MALILSKVRECQRGLSTKERGMLPDVFAVAGSLAFFALCALYAQTIRGVTGI